jgi:DNA-binding response OmpR family regulator
LDIGLPKKTGWEVLTEIRGDSMLCMIPVVLLSSLTTAPGHTPPDYLRLNFYLHKPHTLVGYPLLIAAILHWWTKLAENL